MTALLEWAKLDPRWDSPVSKCRHHSFEEKMPTVSEYLDGSCGMREIGDRHVRFK